MNEIDLKKYVQEVEDLRLLPPVTVEIPLLAIAEIISYIQLATGHNLIRDTEFAKMAIDVARQWQNFFDPSSEAYKILELGWENQSDLVRVAELQKEVFDIFGVETNIDM